MNKKTKKIIPTFSINLDQMYLDTKQPKKHQQELKRYLLDKKTPTELKKYLSEKNNQRKQQ